MSFGKLFHIFTTQELNGYFLMNISVINSQFYIQSFINVQYLATLNYDIVLNYAINTQSLAVRIFNYNTLVNAKTAAHVLPGCW